MANNDSNLKFTENHEWLRVEDDGTVTVGITDYAQAELGDIVYAELPESGSEHAAGDNLVVVESVKAVGEIAIPIDATIAGVNEALSDSPDLINTAPLGDGWLVRVKPNGALPDNLMDEAAYAEFVAKLQ